MEYALSFPEGELSREIARLGLTQGEFAVKAGISSNTLAKAIRGENLRPVIWGKILIALGVEAEVPVHLARKAV